MKFSISSTETETLGLYRMVENITVAFIHAVMEDKARSAERPEPVTTVTTVSGTVAPATAPEAAPQPPDERTLRRIETGRRLFSAMAGAWASNLGIEGAPQPDRVGVLRAVATGPESGAVLNYVSSVGGLAHATDAAITLAAFRLKRDTDHTPDDESPAYLRAAETPEEEEAARRACVNAVAINIAQVSSLFFSDLCAMYEHRDIYRED